MGRLSIRRCSIVSVVEVRVVSTASASDDTVTNSCAAATERTIGKSACWPTVMLTSGTSTRAKPGASIVTLYLPGGSASRLYCPSLLFEVERWLAFPCSWAVTVALVTTLPFGSFTVTCRSPLAAPWARLNRMANNRSNASKTNLRLFISLPTFLGGCNLDGQQNYNHSPMARMESPCTRKTEWKTFVRFLHQ